MRRVLCTILALSVCLIAVGAIGFAQSVREITLVAWTIGPDEPSINRFQNLKVAAERLNKELQSEGSNIRVKVDGLFDTTTWGDFKSKFVLASQAGKGPDIVCGGHEDVAPWGDGKYIISLDSYINKYWAHTYHDIFPALWNSVTYKGQRWGVPQDTEARPMFYNKAALRKLGWTEAQIDALPDRILKGDFTLYDMLALAKEAQDKGIIAKGLGYYHRPRPGYDFYQYYQIFGGSLQDPGTGKLVLDRKALLAYLQFHYDTVFTHGTTPKDYLGTEWRIWHESVSSGKAMFWNGGTWHWAEWNKVYKVPEEQMWRDFGFALNPAATKGGRPGTLSHPVVYMITTGCQNPEIAFRLITLATASDLNSKHAVESGHLAIRKAQLDDAVYKQNRFLRATAYMSEYAGFIPNHPKFGVYDGIVFRALSAVEGGQVKPEMAVEIVIDELKTELGGEVLIR